MKLLQIFFVFFIFIGSGCFSLTNSQDVLPISKNETRCPVRYGHHGANSNSLEYAYDIVSQKLCYREALGNETPKDLPTLQDARLFAKKFCPKTSSSIEVCLHQEMLNMQKCENATVTDLYQMISDTLIALLNYGCTEGGERLALFVYGIASSEQNATVSEAYGKCLVKSLNVLKLTFGAQMDAAICYLHLHRRWASLKECLKFVPVGGAHSDVVEKVYDIVSTHIQCYHPLNETVIPCKAVDQRQLNTSHICNRESGGVVYEQLEESAGRCLYTLMTTTGNASTVLKKMERFCSALEQYNLQKCLDKETMRGDICLDENEAQENDRFRDVINTALKATCMDLGGRLSNVLSNISSSQLNECIRISRESESHNHNTKNLKFYHQMKKFKSCVMDAVEGNSESKESAEWLLNQTLENAKCLNTTGHHSIIVPCKELHVIEN